MEIFKKILFILIISNIFGIKASCTESNFENGLGKLLHRCCVRGVTDYTPMGMPITKQCECFDKLNIKMDGVIANIRKVFNNPRSELLKVKIKDSTRIINNIEVNEHEESVIDRPQLNPIWGKIGFIKCDDNLFLAHFHDIGTKRIWSVFSNNGGMRAIAQCNID